MEYSSPTAGVDRGCPRSLPQGLARRPAKNNACLSGIWRQFGPVRPLPDGRVLYQMHVPGFASDSPPSADTNLRYYQNPNLESGGVLAGTLSFASRNHEASEGDWVGCAQALVDHGLPVEQLDGDYSDEVVDVFRRAREERI